MFLENHIALITAVLLFCLFGGVYIAFVVTKPSKPKRDSNSDKSDASDDPLKNARAGYLEKLQEIARPVMTRYLVYCQEKRDENGYVDSSLTRFEQEADLLYDNWKKETQLCNSGYMLQQIFEKYQSRVELLCAEQNEYLDIIAAFPSRLEKVYQ